ncbi:SRPBCC family protein [Pseudarthrobacter sp. H2]|uniref:SRPBCC family protein n=1 Tax=Pseudarthrobacter sp. H2 TaxID=3418415 RepID=UPI003CEE3583
MTLGTRRTVHRLSIDAPEDVIFSMLRDSAHWPYLDGLTVYSERVSGDDSNHELRTSVVANGSLSSRRCRRVFNAVRQHAEFRQLDVEAPFLALGGAWDIQRADGQSEVTLSHEYELDDDAEELAERVTRYIDEFCRRELEALRLSSERLSLLLQRHSAAREA